MDPDGTTKEVAKPPSIVFVKSWQSGEDTNRLEKEKHKPPFLKREQKGPGNYGPARLTSVPSKIEVQILLETVQRHMENKEQLLTELQYGQIVPDKFGGSL